MSSTPNDIEFIARGLFLRGTSILICDALKRGYGYLPGGHIEFGESATEALAREMIEEAGVEITTGPLLLSFENRFSVNGKAHQEIALVFAASVPDDAEITSLEPKIGFHWRELDDLVGYDLKPHAMRDWIIEKLRAGGFGPDAAQEWVSENENRRQDL